MRARFVRGQEPNRALRIGKYATSIGRIEDLLQNEIPDILKFLYNGDISEFKIYISKDGKRIGIFFPETTPMGIHTIFQYMNTTNLFKEIDRILDDEGKGYYIGANLSDPEYWQYDIEDDDVGGKFMEFYILQ